MNRDISHRGVRAHPASRVYFVGIMDKAYPSGKPFERRYGPYTSHEHAHRSIPRIVAELSAAPSLWEGQPETVRVIRVTEDVVPNWTLGERFCALVGFVYFAWPILALLAIALAMEFAA